jgi:hypothetical protein
LGLGDAGVDDAVGDGASFDAVGGGTVVVQEQVATTRTAPTNQPPSLCR